ncbi:hypothetical protein C5167_021885 [Papaver somniferum]|uniref:Uncharacterized protein n=1 Tax=Papaver somniferum TaxID=3469 RepID=A0A4Y7JJE4_PAPSO|nr:hypothetical protein C5167_021885 [Papaver somniferum]
MHWQAKAMREDRTPNYLFFSSLSRHFIYSSVSNSANQATIALATASANATTTCNFVGYPPSCIFHLLDQDRLSNNAQNYQHQVCFDF